MTEVSRIETLLASRFQGSARLVPSARLGLVVALESLLAKGGRVAMIGSLCEVVAFSVHAAGHVPVFVDSDELLPRLDVEGLRELDVGDIDAVIGTNLYGIPEAMLELSALCRERGWKLIEDAAQVLDSSVGGRRVGCFGDAAVFSFKKFFDESCGAVICRDPARSSLIDEALTRYAQPATARARVRARLAKMANSAGLGWSRALLNRLGGRLPKKTAPSLEDTRLPCPREALSGAMSHQRAATAMDAILSLDDPFYAVYPPKAQLERLLGKLMAWDRLAGSVRDSGRRVSLAAQDARLAVLSEPGGCYLALPTITRERRLWAQHLWETEGVRVTNVYNPPLPDYLPRGTYLDLRRNPRRDLRWSHDLLPIPIAEERRILRAISSFGGRARA